ncbi:unnamed protein product [Leptosia nina]|uniref:Ubiquinone biosynthesis O-methyltransferase, mitochondrial n=1 Tax=Leptosia nina TaxID=320188 RepID=A0AAV1K0M6_9NEOP
MYKNVLIQTTLRRSVTMSNPVSTSNKPNSTVDEGDVQRHSRLMKEWWDPKGILGTLHSFNNLRVPFVRDGLVAEKNRTLTPLANQRILDVGCGGGILSEGLAKIGAVVTGVDASKELIECAKEHSNVNPKITDNKPTYYCTTIEEHAVQFPNYYDAVVASEVIEHVANKELFVKSCVATLKPGGRIFITTPNRSRWTQVLGIYVSENIIKTLPKGTHQYEKLTTPNEVTFLLERNCCQVELIHGIMYYPFIDRWTWVRYKTLMFGLQAVKLNPEEQ